MTTTFARFAAQLAAHGPMLLAISSTFLALGALAVALARTPIHRQRLAELSVLAALAWLVLAVLPLPRLALPRARAAFPADAPVDHREPAPPTVPAASPTQEPAIDALPIAMTTAEEPARDAGTAHESREVSSSPADVEPLVAALSTTPPRIEAPPPDGLLSTLSLATALARLWLGAAAMSLAYLALGGLLLARTLARATAAPDWLAELATGVAQAFDRAPPRLRITASRARPFCLGIGRGLVVIPASLCHDATEIDVLRDVLRHEIAHLRQRDALGHLLFLLALPIFVLHPLYWWLRRRARFAAELLADDCAAAHSTPGAYARQLVRLAARASPAQDRLLGAVPILSSPSDFYRRMTMLLARNSRLATHCSRVRRLVQGTLAMTLTLGTASLFGVADIRAQESPPGARDRESTESLERECRDLRAEIDRLRELLDTQKVDKRNQQIAEQRDQEALKASVTTCNELLAGLYAKDPAKRGEALDGVATQHPLLARTFIPVIRERLRDPDTVVRCRALLALGTLKAREALPDIIDLLGSEDAPVRSAAQEALANMTGSIKVASDLAQATPAERAEAARDWRLLATNATRNADGRTREPGPAGNARSRATDEPPAPASTVASDYLLDLVTRAIDLQSDAEAARVRAARAERLAKSGIDDPEQLQLAQIELQRAVRKLETVRATIQLEREATGAQLARLQRLLDETRQAGGATGDLESRQLLMQGRMEWLGRNP